MVTVSTDIQFLKGVGEKRAVVLKSKGIDTIGALLRFYPRNYLDWTDITPIDNAPFDENLCIKAKVITPVETIKTNRNMTLYRFLAHDGTEQIEITLFNQYFLAEKLRIDREYLFYGKVSGSFFYKKMSSPVILESEFCGIQPIYSANEKLSSKAIEKLVKTALNTVELVETLPKNVIKRNNLCDIKFALWNIHFPTSKAMPIVP